MRSFGAKQKDNTRKDCLWERFASSHKVSVKVCKTWLIFHQTKSKSGQATKEMTERENWIQDKFNFCLLHLSHHREEPVLGQPQPTTFHEDPQIVTVWRPASVLTKHINHPFPALPTQVWCLSLRQSTSRSWINLPR